MMNDLLEFFGVYVRFELKEGIKPGNEDYIAKGYSFSAIAFLRSVTYVLTLAASIKILFMI